MLPSKTPMDSPYAEPIRRALLAARGVEPLLYPTLGASLPDYVFTKIFGVPAFIVPYANADEANHAPNENLEDRVLHRRDQVGFGNHGRTRQAGPLTAYRAVP